MLHLVQCADRLADALGFGVMADAQAPSIEDVLDPLPEAARTRLGNEYEQWKTDVKSRLQAWQ